MDLLELSKLVFRRWYVALPLLLVAMAATLFTATHIQPEYRADSDVLLVPPALSADTDHLGTTRLNPWLGPGLRNVAKSLVVSLQQGAAADVIAGRGLSKSYTVTLDETLPIINLAAVGRTPAEAIATVQQLADLVKASVLQMQVVYKVPEVERISTHLIDAPSLVSTQTNTFKRVVGAFGVSGLLITFALTIAYDSRRRRNDPLPQPAVAADLPPGPPPGQQVAVRNGSADSDMTAVLNLADVRGAPANNDQTTIIPVQSHAAPSSGEDKS